MARRVTPAQYRSMVQQAQRKQKQAIDKYNREARQHNQSVNREVAKANREITAHNQKVRREINKFNSDVRAHNYRVRANRSRLQSELKKLASRAKSSSFASQQTSVRLVANAYHAVERRESLGQFREADSAILECAEREAANAANLMNALLDDEGEDQRDFELDQDVVTYLASMSTELVDRWKGALFSLNPQNPDAARHFCTSAREVLTRILDLQAPNALVQKSKPGVCLTPYGTPTRREKIAYMLRQCGVVEDTLTEFILVDVNDVIDLFKVFNDGTHGSAGKFDMRQLSALKRRVEDAFGFLATLSE